ncbi:GH36 C-terminal domain-containing protein [Paenibacillus sp. P26]|nr:GH36 C-terminal domain-containing protein [Paenibacillus sp. P26]UUZ97814.1 GH36 C-terminal domain-containing protein [Paenibacillus sp. P25]
MFVSEDRKEALVFYFRVLAEANMPSAKLKLQGLDPNYVYKLTETSERIGGDRLMFAGLSIPSLKGDYASICIHLEA